MIELKNIRAGYADNTVLHDISAVIEKGQLTAVIGTNGSGKSTLLKTMLRLLPLQSGSITLDGKPLSACSRTEIAQKAAYLPQGRIAADMTVAQLVLHGRFAHLQYPRRYSQKDRAIAAAAMQKTGVAAFADRRLQTLSGGMQQNAFLAMALAQSAEYIFLDEPTTYLDISHQLTLMRTLQTLREEGNGIVAVLHDLPLAFGFADKIILLQDGRIVCCDTPAAICAADTVQEVFGVRLLHREDGSYSYAY